MTNISINKTHGSDGLTPEFSETFPGDTNKPFLNAMNQIERSLKSSQIGAVINLSEKKGKHTLLTKH